MSSDSFTLPLRPVRQKTDKPDKLALRIAQINAQRGSFRNVSEAGLEAEIEALKAAGRDPREAVDEKDGRQKEGEGEDEGLARQERLLQSRAEILEFAMQAHAEATYALDFVSLILSKHNPRQAEVSQSHYLKQKIPAGSLGVDVVQPSPSADAERQDVGTVSHGWKLQSFAAAADQLLASASRLEETVAAETRYWSGILEVKEQGWKVCRLPREPQTLGVQFGFLEATPTYRDRGLGALRKRDRGALWLDQGIRTSAPKVLRVRVQKDGSTVGSSIVPAPSNADTADNITVQNVIREARDSLFDEELFYELNREARGLLKHGVELKRNLVQFPADDSQLVVIDLVDLDQSRETTTTSTTAPSDEVDCNSQPNVILQSLRILLCHAHRKNLRRRSQVPAPVTAKKLPTPEYILLRPVFAYLQHRASFRWLASFLDTLTKTLQTAGINLQPRRFPFTSWPPHGTTAATTTTNTPAADSFVDSLLTPLESYITVPLCRPSCGVRVRVFTNMHPNGAGTEFTATTNHPALSHAMKTPLKLGLGDELKQFITYLFTVDLVHFIADVSKRLYPSPAPSPPHQQQQQNPATAETAAATTDESDDWEDEDEDDGSVNPVAELLGIRPTPLPRLSKAARAAQDNIPLLPWELAEGGELTAFSPRNNRTRKLCVELTEQELTLTAHWMVGTAAAAKSGKLGEAECYEWRAADSQAPLSLEEAIGVMGKDETNA